MDKFNWEDFSQKSKYNVNVLTASCYASEKRSRSQQNVSEQPQLNEEDEFSEFSLQRFPEWSQSRIEQNQSLKEDLFREYKSFQSMESFNIVFLRLLADVQDITMISKLRLTEKHGLVFKLKIPPQKTFHIVLKDNSVLEFITIFNIPYLFCYSRNSNHKVNPFDLHRLKKMANIHNWSDIQAILYLRLFKI